MLAQLRSLCAQDCSYYWIVADFFVTKFSKQVMVSASLMQERGRWNSSHVSNFSREMDTEQCGEAE